MIERIQSFNVDHRKIEVGVYVSRIDGDITTYDMRTRKPNTGAMTNEAAHTIEHLFATYVRNSDIKDAVIYFGPMGCLTGFYLLVRNADNAQVLSVIKETLEKIVRHQGEIFGSSEIECGNYLMHSFKEAREECIRYLDKLRDWTSEKMVYPNED